MAAWSGPTGNPRHSGFIIPDFSYHSIGLIITGIPETLTLMAAGDVSSSRRVSPPKWPAK
jgi:hypothetical protein